MKKTLRFALNIFSCTLLLVAVNGCEGWWIEKAAYGEVSAEGEPLRLLVVQRPLTYQRLRELESGFEFELLQQFALDTGYQLKIKTYPNEKSLLKDLANGKGDLAAARFSDFKTDSTGFLKSPVYDEEKASLVCHQDIETHFTANGHLDRNENWKLIYNPTQIENRWIQHFKNDAPRLKISGRPYQNPSKLLQDLAQGKGDCTFCECSPN